MFTRTRRLVANEESESASTISNKSSCSCGCSRIICEKVLPVIKELTERLHLIEASNRQMNNPITTADIINHFEDCISKKKITGSSFVTLLKTHAPSIAALRLVIMLRYLIDYIYLFILQTCFRKSRKHLCISRKERETCHDRY